MSREEQRKETHIFFADAVICFEKLWLQYCIIELEKLGNNKNDLEILYKLNETAQVKINAPYVDTKYITKGIVKTGDNIQTNYLLYINSKSK